MFLFVFIIGCLGGSFGQENVPECLQFHGNSLTSKLQTLMSSLSSTVQDLETSKMKLSTQLFTLDELKAKLEFVAKLIKYNLKDPVYQGDTGQQGATGVQGPPGFPGLQGSKGSIGAPGRFEFTEPFGRRTSH